MTYSHKIKVISLLGVMQELAYGVLFDSTFPGVIHN